VLLLGHASYVVARPHISVLLLGNTSYVVARPHISVLLLGNTCYNLTKTAGEVVCSSKTQHQREDNSLHDK